MLEGRELPMQAGDLLVAPDGVPHGVKNTGKGRLLELAVLAPSPRPYHSKHQSGARPSSVKETGKPALKEGRSGQKPTQSPTRERAAFPAGGQRITSSCRASPTSYHESPLRNPSSAAGLRARD